MLRKITAVFMFATFGQVVFTTTLMFYNTGWQQYRAMVVNYHGKKFYNIAPGTYNKNQHRGKLPW